MAALCLCAASTAQEPAGFVPASSDPESFFIAGEFLCFTANDGVKGRELWATSGEPDEFWLVNEFYPGPDGINVENSQALGDFSLIKVVYPNGEAQLWRTDGTGPGTFQIKLREIVPSASYDGPLAVLKGQLFFRTGALNSTHRLWVTDGTQSGTHPVESVEDLQVEHLEGVALDDCILFPGSYYPGGSNESVAGLWRSDGTAEGTSELGRFHIGPSTLLAVPGGAYFCGETKENGSEYWFSDGTAEGTRMVKEFAPGEASGAPVNGVTVGYSVVFSAWTPEAGRELQVLNTQTNEVRQFDLAPGSLQSDPYKFHLAGGNVFFIASDGSSGSELWCFSTDTHQPVFLRDILPGPVGSQPYSFASVRGGLVFSANAPEIGEELWYSDGTPEGTVLLSDIAPGPMSSAPYNAIWFKGRIYFAATHPQYGRELWYTSAGQATVRLIADVNDDQTVNPSSRPQFMTPLGGVMLFAADDLAHGVELWRTDGTAAGTALVRDIYPGRPSSEPRDLVASGAYVYFAADDGDHGVELWRSDGTTEGTALVVDISLESGQGAGIKELTPYKDRLAFVAYREADGEELWITTAESATRVRDILPGPESSHPRDLAVFEDILYFRANDGVHGEELWRSDGSQPGTYMVKDLVPLPLGDAGISQLAPGSNGLYFQARADNAGFELWMLSSILGGIHRVADIAIITP